jgi:hypothetical protein
MPMNAFIPLKKSNDLLFFAYLFYRVATKGIGGVQMAYKVHRFDIDMNKDAGNLERFLNSLEGEVVSVVPNVSMWAFWIHRVNYLLIIERI